MFHKVLSISQGLKSQCFHLWSQDKFQDRLLILSALIAGSLGLFLNDLININDGLGWDGVIYAEFVEDFEAGLSNYNQYYAQRIFPSVILYYIFRFLGISPISSQIVWGFTIVNMVAIAFAALAWTLIAQQLQISHSGKWFGFTALFLNFMVLKFTSYYPVSTDITAYAIGIWMLSFYLEGNTIGLYVLSALGSLTWPTSIYVGALFLLLPKSDSGQDIGDNRLPSFPWNYSLATIITLLVYFTIKSTSPFMERSQPEPSVILLSISITLVYLFIGISMVTASKELFSFNRWFEYARCQLKDLSFYIKLGLIFVLMNWSRLTLLPPSHIKLGLILQLISWRSIIQPGIFLVSHSVFFGPVFLLFIFLWRPICRTLQQYGLGVTLAAALGVYLSLNSESRHSLLFFVILVPFLVKVTDSLSWSKSHYWMFTIVSLLCSKVWLRIGDLGLNIKDWSTFPHQYLFMNWGNLMSRQMYIVQGVAALLISYWLYDFYVRDRLKPRNHSEIV